MAETPTIPLFIPSVHAMKILRPGTDEDQWLFLVHRIATGDLTEDPEQHHADLMADRDMTWKPGVEPPLAIPMPEQA